MLTASNPAFLLPLGLQIEWESEVYMITGYIVKREKADKNAEWIEYVLTHPSLLNLYLSYFEGHWTMIEFLPDVKRTKRSIKNQYNLTYKKVEYDYQHSYSIEIVDAQGSFNFRFYEDDDNRAREFVHYDSMMIWEENTKDPQIRFYRGKYLFPSELKKRIRSKISLPKTRGHVGHQPFYFPIDGKSFRWMSLLLIATMIVGMTFWQSFFPAIAIHDGQLEVQTDNPNTVSSAPFTVVYDNSILNVRTQVYNMSNDWVYSNLALINTKTGEERYFEMETEYYFGRTDGENWSEGDQDINGNIQYVDAGTYVLEATPQQAAGSVPKTIRFSLTAQKGSWSVFWFLVIVIVLINIVLGFIGDYFNHKKRGEDYDTVKKFFES